MYYPHIDLSRLVSAQKLYESEGFESVHVPWVVEWSAIAATCSDFRLVQPVRQADGSERYLVGSAEQSFLQIMLDQQAGRSHPNAPRLRYGERYQATTPCFRLENEDESHFPYFMKVELFMPIAGTCREEVVLDMADIFAATAHKVMEALLPYHEEFAAKIVPTEEGSDIIHGELELGSYGIRRNDDFWWVYGTGLALPRFDLAYPR